MGGAPSINYCVPVTQKPEGESAIYRLAEFKDQLRDRPKENLGTMKDVILNSSKLYADFPALGTIVKGQKGAEIKYINYKQVLEEAHSVGSGIIREKLYSTPENEKLRMVGLFSKNRVEWSLTDVACLLFNITTIPIYDTLGDENITYVFQHTGLKTCFVNSGALGALMKCKDLVSLSKLVCFDNYTPAQKEYFEGKGVELILFDKLKQIGKEKLQDYNSQEYKVVPEDCLTFSYTSGTTGPPKGAMLSHKNFASFMAAEKFNKDCKFNSDDVALSYLPLPHILEREFDYSIMHKGARLVFFSGDVQKLKDDLAIVKPTIFLSVPRLFSRFYEVLKQKFGEVQGMTKTALQYALNTKLDNLKKTGGYTHKIYDKIFFAKTREALGGRVRIMISGSAPLLPEVQHFLKVTMCAPLIEGYGQTESTGAMLFSDEFDSDTKQVGGPTANFQIKFVDIPQMNYHSTDKNEEGQLTPRGEIWARGPGVFMGYYHDDEKTKEALTTDGWLKTGDVGILNARTKSISIIDRKKNIFKLQQGQYVAAEKVQNIYAKGDKLAEIFIHGDSTETFVIAIIVPHKRALQALAAEKGIQGTFQQLCQNEAIRVEIVIYLNKIGKEAGLAGFEQAKNVYLESAPFLTKGILTNTMKIQRHEAKKVYRPIIDKLYKQGMLKTDKK